MDVLFEIIGIVTYVAMGIAALWGAYCAVMVWMRVGHVRFRDEEEQQEFLEELSSHVSKGDFSGAIALCEDDRRALPQLALYGIENRELGLNKVQRQIWERFQTDVLGEIEHGLSWVATVVKSAPMMGLFGTVMGMMGAFGNIASAGSNVEPSQMAGDIMFALITTAAGLAIALPLLIVTNGIVVRIRKMEELVGIGIAHLADVFRPVFPK
jgi:biopolymer transport protein ExbB